MATPQLSAAAAAQTTAVLMSGGGRALTCRRWCILAAKAWITPAHKRSHLAPSAPTSQKFSFVADDKTGTSGWNTPHGCWGRV